jgi:Na+-driven multidrug efflux pump
MRSELKAMLALALPVILSELGWIMMGIVDTLMVSPLGPAAIGAVGTGSTIFMSVMIFGMGTLFALDTYVSQSFGAGRIDGTTGGSLPACSSRPSLRSFHPSVGQRRHCASGVR